MAIDVNATRRQRAWDSISDVASRTWARTLRGSSYLLTLTDPQIRTLNGTQVFSVDMQARRGPLLFFDDRINMPNPPQGVRVDATTVTDNPLQALRDTLVDVLRACTNDLTTPHLMRGAGGQFRGDTLAVRAGTADGTVTSSDASWNTARDGSGLSANTAGTTASPRANPPGVSYQIRTYYAGFDTSSLGATATISTSVFTLYGTGTAESVTDGAPAIQVRPKAWGGTLTTADWIDLNPTTNWTGLTLMADFTLSTWDQTNNAANNLTHRSSADINKTGTTEVAITLDTAAAASAPTGQNDFECYAADNAGTSSDPLLTVTYTVPPSGTIAATLQKALFSGSGTQTQTGTVAATLAKATAAFTGGQEFTGTAAATLQRATFAGTGGQTAGPEGTVGATLRAATASLTGAMEPSGAVAATLQKATFSGAGAHEQTGTVAATLQEPTFAASGAQTQTGTVGATLQKATFAGTGGQEFTGTIAATLQRATFAAVGFMVPEGAIVSTLQKATFAASGAQTIPGVIAATLRRALFAGVGTQTQTGTVAATLRRLVFSALGVMVWPDASATLSDAYAQGARLSDTSAYGGTLSDANQYGGRVSDE